MRADVAALPQGEAISVTAVWVAGGNISCLDDDELNKIEIESAMIEINRFVPNPGP